MDADAGTLDELECFFEPKSVAVVGASRNPLKFGHSLLENLLDLEFKGKIYVVNPNADEILGLKTYPRVDSIEEDVELAVIIVPASKVPEVLRDCSKKHVKGVVICSSGFRETGETGQNLENEVLAIAKKAGIRVIGPNTTGIVNTSNNFTTSFVALPKLKRGNVAFIAQTGLFAAAAFWWIVSKQPFGISKIVGLGNKCDVDDAEVLEYLAEDQDTQVIAIYMEGVKEGRKLFEVFEKVARKKPIIVLKSGRSPAGMKASLSHTGSLAVKDEIFDAVCRQTGAIRISGDLEDLLDITKAFALQPLPKGNKVAIITASGAAGVMAADECAKNGLELATLSNETLSRIRSRMPPWAVVNNPIDVEPLFEVVGPEESIRIALAAASEDINVDSVLVLFVAVPRLIAIFNAKNIIIHRKKEPLEQKTMLTQFIGFKETVDSWTTQLEEENIPVYSSIERCVRALGYLWAFELNQAKNA
ncbi:MAG TPA: CoA-binding protein [candidate division Zixibacteria bacterium]|nr:CoA-binding protein [candidate division Zixibacteria bacterium]